MRKVYLDNNATTPLHPAVKERIIEALDTYGNPSSMHEFGRMAHQEVEAGRAAIANLINADPEEIIFVGSGSEGNNTVLSNLSCSGRKCMLKLGVDVEIITTSIEHPCIMESSKCVNDQGVKVDYLDVDQYGKVNIEQYKELLEKQPLLVSIMMANNEIGTVQDIKLLAKMAHEKGALFHTDAVQAVGKIPVDVKDLDVDFLTISAHKIYGPKGIGALYIKKDTPFCPLIHGGHQERGRRAGTENTLGIIGFGKAAEMRKIEMDDEASRLWTLKKEFKQGIIEKIPNVEFIGHPTDNVPGTLNVSFGGVEGEAILLYLDLEGIMVSTGSACASGSLDPSHVILATGIDEELAHGSIRFSMGRSTTKEDMDYTLDVLVRTIERLRKMSTF